MGFIHNYIWGFPKRALIGRFKYNLTHYIYNMTKRYKRVPTYKEMKQELNKTDHWLWSTIAKALYYTGARSGELIQIRTKDIWQDEDDAEFVSVRLLTEKNKKALSRIVPIFKSIEPEAAELFLNLKNGLSNDDLVFLPEFKLDTTFLRDMRRNINKFYDGVAPHYFRHCRLTHMVTKFNYNEQELIHYAGWSDSRPANTYMHLNVKNLQDKMRGGL